MIRLRFRYLFPALAVLAMVGVFAFSPGVFAQTDNLQEIADASGLGTEDPRIIVANIIRVVLGVLGVLAVVIVVYGGFVWMTAGGNDEKVERAKKILVRGVIGLTIILLSWAITTFVISAILGATNGGNSGSGSGSGTGGGLGGSTSSAFTVSSYSPDGAVDIRNVVLQVVFTKNLDSRTVDGNIRVINSASGERVEGTTTVSGNRASFQPTAACPSPNEDRYCFDADTEFDVEVSTDIKSTTNATLVCSGDRCASSFTTGSIVDTEDPIATLTDPESGDGVEAGSSEAVQVQATDDSEVATADFAIDDTQFDSVSATGDTLSNVTIESVWDTTQLVAGEAYRVMVTVTDIAGNTDTDIVRVTARGAWCFNTSIDTDRGETGLNCGGDSSSSNYCGACDGAACTDDTECSSGSCVSGVCTTLPEITAFSPDSGAVGTFVTLSGTGFGTTTGTVTFAAADGGSVIAESPSCTDGWSSTEIVVAVPEGAVDGPISIITNDGVVETTADDSGVVLDDFDVNDVVHPKLCRLSPDSGSETDAVTLSGLDFGDARGSSTVEFTGTAAGSYTSWEDASVAVTVPALDSDTYDVTVTVDGVASNSLTFTATEEAAETPVIVSIDPASGVIGDYVTLQGTNFGSRIGTVRFVSADGYEAIGEVDFPAVCGSDYWADDAVTVIVPSRFQNGTAVTAGDYAVYLVAQDGSESATIDFTVVDGSPSPGICSLTPDSGLAGDTVVISGERFGTTEGTVTFYNGQSATVTTGGWSESSVTVTAPSGVATGPVTITVDGDESNGVNFAATAGTTDTADAPGPASYGWYFSTGEIPETPAVVTECSDDTISAVPNQQFSGDVCVNAVVYAEFTTVMNTDTLASAVTVNLCTANGDEPCDAVTEVTDQGVLTTQTSSVNSAFTWQPNEALTAGATYQVIVSTEALSDDGVAMAAATEWEFTTSATADSCSVDTVRVSPGESTIDTQYATETFYALPSAGCVRVAADDYTWDWSVDESIAADSECASGLSSCALVQGNVEGVTNVAAEEIASATVGSGVLTIAFTDPYISQYWPDCTGACSNGAIGATFNTIMDRATFEAVGAAVLYACDNELCAVGVDDAVPVTVDATDCTSTPPTSCSGISLTPLSGNALSEGSYYRVVLSGGIQSMSGVALTRTNYGGDFSWIFRVKDGEAVCTMNRLTVSPEAATAGAVGERQEFTAEGYGEPDECSVAGQRLVSTGYDWSFGGWIDDGEDASIDVAAWWNTARVDTDISDLSNGCSASCVAEGSMAYAAICGDGVVGTGEECEDGNTADGDGCSSSCLRDGNADSGVCGDGILDRDADLGGEDCDDGNVVDEDGCSAQCLNEGSRSVGATCGNNYDVAYTAVTGGEDCDDNNVTSGDGCSNVCLHEGTPTRSDVGGAICGDGVISAPYETCDDGGSVNFDGCSATCVREGSGGTYGDCGDNTVDRGVYSEGEDCDGGEGCSDSCTFSGSSTTYSVPSFCGDGQIEIGESCESSGGDGNRDALQLGEIAQDAAQEVDIDTNIAIASMTVSEASSGLSASATYTLSCSATTDLDCSDPETVGLGDGGCCMDRPSVVLYPNGSNTCRNAEIYGFFTQEMDLTSFTYLDATTTPPTTEQNMYLVLDVSTTDDGVCPIDHTQLAQAATLPWYAEAWFTIRRVFVGTGVAAATDDCVIPVTSYAQEAQSDGTSKVVMHYAVPMAANATYTLRVVVDATLAGGEASGVRSVNGVALYDVDGVIEQSFTTGSDICTFDAAVVTDTDDSQNYFSQTGEAHLFTATAYSYNGATAEPIESLEGEYAWDWTDWDDDSDAEIVEATGATGAGDEHLAAVEAMGTNGEATVFATATITADTLGGTVGDTIVGEQRVTAYLCENTWPDITLGTFPWSDTEEGVSVGATEGTNGWMNFSSYYCRDKGESDDRSDDYSDIDVVFASDYSLSDDILKEYLFEIGDGSGDAVGIRVVTNDEYLSPSNWFTNKGFSGTPTVTTVDGFEAITDGRTTYVAAANQNDSSLYSNIYVISYNENASTSTVDIYNQLLDNITFATNLESSAMCYKASGTSLALDAEGEVKYCDDDSDCSLADNETCADDKSKLVRDTKRLADMTTIAVAVNTYRATNGMCSLTVAKSCTADDDCPGTETCEAVVPTLSSGTYVRSLGASAWSSWGDLLGGALGTSTLVADPLNEFQGCGTDPFATYNADTCVDQTTGRYVCPENSYTYHYRAVGSEEYILASDLEYTAAAWVNPIDVSSSDEVAISVYSPTSTAGGFTATPFCDGSTVYGSEGVCGDGVVNGSETCELGESGGSSATCDIDSATDSDGNGTSDDDEDGIQSQTCNATCNGWETNSDAVCIAPDCGDGVIDSGETCDDGALNGRYGYCGNTCTYDSAFYCGDGSLAGSEVCDCGAPNVSTISDPTDSLPYGGAGAACVSAEGNGLYGADGGTTCAWDCQGPASYCGDGVVDSTEDCDGDTDSWAGSLCYVPFNENGMDGEPCTTSAECKVGEFTNESYRAIAWCKTSPTCEAQTRICLAGNTAEIGHICTLDNDCDTSAGSGDGICSTDEYDTTRVRTCTDTCEWSGSWSTIECTSSVICGNGVVEEYEECDDGNTDSTDACTNACTANVCGDGYLYVGEEDCDEGVDNGGSCDSAYGSTCTACSVSCRYEVASGNFCGDGITNGREYCDAYDMPYYYARRVEAGSTSSGLGAISWDASVDTASACNVLGATAELVLDSEEPTVTDTFTCSAVGMCNGGTSSMWNGVGAACLSDADCSSGSCALPACDDSCTSVCPETYTSSSLVMEANEPGSPRVTSIDLYSYSSDPVSELPNAAEITFPECRVGATLTADISFDILDTPEAYILFVNDTSSSMDYAFDGSIASSAADKRITASNNGLIDAMALFFANVERGYAMLYQNGNIGGFNGQTEFSDYSNESTLSTIVTANYSVDSFANSGLDTALSAAKSEFASLTVDTDARKILILLSSADSVTTGADSGDIASEIQNLKDDGVEIYTIVVSTVDVSVSSMESWSSNNASDETIDIDYTYVATDSDEVADAYTEIINTLYGVNFSILSSDGSGGTLVTTEHVEEGSGVQLPWPEGFSCDSSDEQQLPIRATFAGDGQIEISNVQFEYCAP